MARLPFLAESDLAPQDRELLARGLNLYRVLAHSPEAARVLRTPAYYVRHDSPLDPRLRELAILQVGYVTRTAYEYAHHVELGRTYGVTDDDLRALAAETAGRPSGLPALERAVLRAARELAAAPRLDDATFAALQTMLPPRHLVDLLLAIALYCAVVRILGALQIELEPGYEAILAEFPLPAD